MSIIAQVERFAAMGTRVELHIFGASSADGPAAARRAIEVVDDALTIHRPSPTTAMNDALLSGRGVTLDDPVLIDALIAIQDAHALTYGLFDPTADRRFGEARWSDVTFDPAAARISATRPLALDFGGIGKGVALDRACAVLRDAGVVSACLSAGESSLSVIGEHPLGGGWPFAIPDPSRVGELLVTLELVDEALSISTTVGSGTDAPERATMMRPSDGTIVTAARCAVAINRSGSRAEALSTALLVASDDQAQALVDSEPSQRLLYDLFRETVPTVDVARMQPA